MNFIPRQTKFKKMFRFSVKNGLIEKRTNNIVFGSFGIFSKSTGFIVSKQVEAIRRVFSKKLKKKGKYWIRIFPNRSMTKKSVGVRMGKGKGNIAFWAFPIHINRILFEFDGVNLKEAKKLFNLCSAKFSVKTALVYKKNSL